MSRVANWSKWMPLNGAGRNQEIPVNIGLYRIRVKGTEKVIYIGETGEKKRGLRGRVGSLASGTYRLAEMPYRDPHTAAPALWALRDRDGVDFEVSISVFEGPKVERKMLEAIELACHRSMFGSSPAFNFGRMPHGYKMSSGNNSGLIERGLRFRGGPTEQNQTNWLPSCPPVGQLDDDVTSTNWCGHTWSDWKRLEQVTSAQGDQLGFYRIRSAGASKLIYLGQGQIFSRLRAHLSKVGTITEQGEILSSASPLEASFARSSSSLPSHQMEELETDLIGTYGLKTGSIPEAQFIG